MSLLGDLLTELAGSVLSGIGLPTDRVQSVLLSATGLVLFGINGWLFLTSPSPISEPAWGGLVVALGILLGAAGVMWSGLLVTRSGEKKGFASLALLANLAALIMALGCVLSGKASS